MKDALVVGLGLAGVGVVHALRSSDATFTVVDVPLPHCGSPVAAGLMLPITGPRWVLRPRYAELLAIAKTVYGTLMTPLRVHRLLSMEHDPKLEKRRSDKDYTPYMSERIPPTDDPTLDAFGRVQWDAHCLDVPALLQTVRQRLSSEGNLVQARFSHDDVQYHADHIAYAGGSYRWLILCTGHRAMNAVPFAWLRYRPSHGEWCELDPIDGLDTGVIERRHWLHSEPHRARLGSTYGSGDLDVGVTEGGRAALVQAAETLVKPEVHVTKMHAGVRAAAIDWSPYVGTSPTHPRAALVAGLGSTGGLLAPYCGKALVERLMSGHPIPSWIDLSRRDRDRAVSS